MRHSLYLYPRLKGVGVGVGGGGDVEIELLHKCIIIGDSTAHFRLALHQRCANCRRLLAHLLCFINDIQRQLDSTSTFTALAVHPLYVVAH